ncbi:MAG: type II secretion system protein GspG, partial [Betaproteobacteria bacterium]|nr:type II secretion system protein GspG [Betaproteobacteria bacterium]
MAEQANMICPSCRTFQPRAEVCSKCGVVVAKVWDAQRGADRKSSVPETRKRPWAKVGVIVLIAVPIIGFFIFSGTRSSKEAGDKTAARTSDEQKKGKTLKSIDKIAAFNPQMAANVQRIQVLSKLQSLRTRFNIYEVEGGEPPSNEEGLQALVNKGFLRQADITDEWGNTFVYRLEWGKKTPFGQEYKIYVHSKGPDGIDGTSDDVMLP